MLKKLYYVEVFYWHLVKDKRSTDGLGLRRGPVRTVPAWGDVLYTCKFYKMYKERYVHDVVLKCGQLRLRAFQHKKCHNFEVETIQKERKVLPKPFDSFVYLKFRLAKCSVFPTP